MYSCISKATRGDETCASTGAGSRQDCGGPYKVIGGDWLASVA